MTGLLSTIGLSSTLPVTTAFSPAPAGPSRQNEGQSRSPFVTSARTSFSAACYAISRISTANSAIGSTWSPTLACTPRSEAWSMKLRGRKGVAATLAPRALSVRAARRHGERRRQSLQRCPTPRGGASLTCTSLLTKSASSRTASTWPLIRRWRAAARSGSIRRIENLAASRAVARPVPATLTRAGDHAPRRSLDFYAAVGRRLAARGGTTPAAATRS